MKLHFVTLLLVGLSVHATLGDCLFENETLSVGEHIRKCLRINCTGENTMSMLACPLYQCPVGKEIGYREVDLSKPYPECCAGPICAE
ncbi:Single domain-containing protein [Camponotus japonicus]